MSASTGPPPPADGRRLLGGTLAALAVAALVLVTAVLPAEYGLDPTGIGGALGLTRLAGGTDADADAGEPEGVTPPSETATFAAFEASYPGRAATALALDGYLAAGETVLVPVPLDLPNVTSVRARLEFADANETAGGRTRPDLFEVQVKAPNGDVGDAALGRSDPTSGGGIAEARLEWREKPVPREVDAASEADARRAFLANDPPDESAAGEWIVRVTLVEAGGAEANGIPLPGAAGGATDAGNDWTLTVTVVTFDLDVREKPGTRARADTTELALPARGELEYKLRMALGGSLEYAWRTDGPSVYVDFHGEKEGDSSGAFTRHKNGDYAEDAGTLVAPFDGRQGWFWRNPGDRAVTLTLETRGAYDVIGVV